MSAQTQDANSPVNTTVVHSSSGATTTTTPPPSQLVGDETAMNRTLYSAFDGLNSSSAANVASLAGDASPIKPHHLPAPPSTTHNLSHDGAVSASNATTLGAASHTDGVNTSVGSISESSAAANCATIRRPPTVGGIGGGSAATPVTQKSLNSSLDTNNGSAKFASEESPSDDRHYIVVSRLDTCTTRKMLLDLFFPYGALDATMLTSTTSVPGITNTMRRTGFVVFPSQDMARLARDKMNQFIPCRQTLALSVMLCSLQEVKDALHRDSFASSLDLDLHGGARPQSNTAKLSLLVDMSGTNPQHIAAYIQQTSDPELTARELVDELDDATPQKIIRFADSLAAVMDMWPHKKHLQTCLVRSLLSAILHAQPRAQRRFDDDLPPLNASTETSPRRVNSGHLLGLLFVNGFIPGDPYEVASRLLKSELSEVAQLTAICKIIEPNPSANFPTSAATFWNLMTEMTATHQSPEMRYACSQRLSSRLNERQAATRGLSPDAKPFQSQASRGTSPLGGNSPLSDTSLPSPLFPSSSNNVSFGNSAQTAQQRNKAEESRTRTIYVSRLSPNAPAWRFRNLLDECGMVNRVRVCREQGYSTLFGFVEMATREAARNLIRRDKELFYDSQVRFQPAKMPVQDEDNGDALFDAQGQRLRLCDFALHCPQSTSVATLAAYMKGRK